MHQLHVSLRAPCSRMVPLPPARPEVGPAESAEFVSVVAAAKDSEVTAANAIFLGGELKSARRVKRPAVKLINVLEDIFDYHGMTAVAMLFTQVRGLVIHGHGTLDGSSHQACMLDAIE